MLRCQYLGKLFPSGTVVDGGSEDSGDAVPASGPGVSLLLYKVVEIAMLGTGDEFTEFCICI